MIGDGQHAMPSHALDFKVDLLVNQKGCQIMFIPIAIPKMKAKTSCFEFQSFIFRMFVSTYFIYQTFVEVMYTLLPALI